MAENEKIDHPSHYGGAGNPYEAIRVIEAWLGTTGAAYFCLGSALKYMARAGKKSGETFATDLAKAQWYMRWVIEHAPDAFSGMAFSAMRAQAEPEGVLATMRLLNLEHSTDYGDLFRKVNELLEKSR